ncbi:MAG: mechanosensitive ion channel [Anaerolineae bacterium]|nr:mechanosensitive ion channel [Anaerolineae bacterium]MCO5190276.1 mechanosensitive ion channel [Anaerolineae bacterium]
MDISQITLDTIVDWLAALGLRLVAAALVLIIGRWVARLIQRAALRAMQRAEFDETLIKFLGNLLYYLLLAAVIVGALAIVGVQTASIAAAIAAVGLAIGLALQGALSNFAAGILLLLFRPYNVEDFVKVNNVSGRVESLQIFNTVVVTPQNEKVIVPNGEILSNNITNYTARDYVRLDLVAGISYGDNIRDAKMILEDIVTTHPQILTEPAPRIGVAELADSSVNLAVQLFVRFEDFWLVKFDVTEQIKLRMDEAGISIPFPQRELHLIQPE